MALSDLEINPVKQEEDKSCFNCIHIKVCKINIQLYNEIPFVLDVSIPEYSDNYKKLFQTIAEVCRFYEWSK